MGCFKAKQSFPHTRIARSCRIAGLFSRFHAMHQSPSIDPKEVAYYQRTAALWWDESGPFWPLHRLNTLRVQFITECLADYFRLPRENERPLAGLSMLDIGCGGGILSESMARRGASVHGVDVVRRNIEIARLHSLTSELDILYEESSAEALAESGLSYNVVLNMEVVEHVADLSAFMGACCRLVRPGGVMIVATINRTLASLLAAKIGAEYVLRWLPRGTHRWLRFRTPATLDAYLRDGGLTVTKRIGVAVNPWSRCFSLTEYLGINYMLVATKPSA